MSIKTKFLSEYLSLEVAEESAEELIQLISPEEEKEDDDKVRTVEMNTKGF